MKKFAVIVAGGSGLRMGSPVPKQFLLVRGKPVLWHTLRVFLAAYDDLSVTLVLPEEHLEKGAAIAGAFGVDATRIQVVTGGNNRFHSVQNGLREVERLLAAEPAGVSGGDAVIFVHDGVRCLLTADLVQRCYEQAVRLGSAIPVVGCRDSVRVVKGADASTGEGTRGSEVLDRNSVRLVQTPQTFLAKILLPAYKTEYNERFTDEATVVEAAGQAVHLVEGEPFNSKITLPVDLIVAEQMLRERE